MARDITLTKARLAVSLPTIRVNFYFKKQEIKSIHSSESDTDKFSLQSIEIKENFVTLIGSDTT